MTVVSVDREALVGVLERLKKLAARPPAGKGEQPTKPISFAAQRRHLVLEAGNKKERVTCTLPAAVTGAAATSSVPPEPLLALLKATKSTTVTITLGGDRFTVETLPVKACIATVPNDLPKLPQARGTSIPLAPFLRTAILRAVKHASTDRSRPVLGLVLFDRGAVVGTDSFTMVVSEGLRMFPTFAVAAEALGRAVALAGDDAELVVGTKSIRIGDSHSATTLERPSEAGVDMASVYPDWRKMLARSAPATRGGIVEFSRDEMLVALRDPLIIDPDGVTITQDNYQRARQPLQVTAAEEMGVGATGSDVQATMGKLPGPLSFNTRQFKRALETHTGGIVRMIAARPTPAPTPPAPARLVDGHCTVIIVPKRPS